MKLVRKFAQDRSGNFAMMFSFLAVPLLLGGGLAIDYTNLSRVRSSMQSSADSAVLAVAQRGDNINNAEADVIGDAFFDENFTKDFVNTKVTRVGTDVDIVAWADVPMSFGGLFGFGTVRVTVDAAADISEANYEIALSLDTTGSMEGGKLAAMKDAVKVLIDNLDAQNPKAGSLKISIVPFSSMVNVGPQFGPAFGHADSITRQPAAWLDTMAKSPISQADLQPGVSRFVMYKHLGVTWPGCVEARPVVGGVDFGTSDAAPNPSNPATLFVPSFASDEPDLAIGPNGYLSDWFNPIGGGTVSGRMSRYGANYSNSFLSMTFAQQVTASSTWNDRNPNYSLQNYYTNYPVNKGPDFSCDVQPIMPLTTDFNGLKAKVDSLVALGSTNIFEGAMWGWRVLSNSEPFTQGAPANKVGVRKIMVLLTDGTNDMGLIPNSLGSSYGSFGYISDGRLGISGGNASQVADAMNAKTLAACTNAKANGVEIFTIRLEVPNVTTGNMLRDCASAPENYLDVPNRSTLDEAFASLIKKIVVVRLAS